MAAAFSSSPPTGACGEVVLRIAWSAPVPDAAAIRTELIHLARAARGT